MDELYHEAINEAINESLKEAINEAIRTAGIMDIRLRWKSPFSGADRDRTDYLLNAIQSL